MSIPWLDTERADAGGKPIKKRISSWVSDIKNLVHAGHISHATQRELELYRQTLYAIRAVTDFPEPKTIRQVRKMASAALLADEIEYERQYGS